MNSRQFKTLMIASVAGFLLMIPLALFGFYLVLHFLYQLIVNLTA